MTQRFALYALIVIFATACGAPAAGLHAPTPTPLPSLSVVNPQTVWRYALPAETSGPAWRSRLDFDDSDWTEAQLPLGTVRPVRTFVGDALTVQAVYLRTTFEANDPGLWRTLTLTLEYVNGAAVYLNGAEITRVNLPDDVGPTTPATARHDTPAEVLDVTEALNLVRPGRNLLAAEVHSLETDGQLRIAVDLRARWWAELPQFVFGPVLGQIGADTVTLLAESDTPATAILGYRASDAVTSTTTTITPTTRHLLTLGNLQAGTTYHYLLGLQGESGTTWSPVGQWTTDGGPGQSFRFAVWADSRPISGSAPPLVFSQLVDVLRQRGPLALGIALGDNLQLLNGVAVEGAVRDRYINYLAALRPLVREMPFYAALGDFDAPDCAACLDAFRHYFPLPEQNDGTYYSFDYGSAHFALLNTRQGGGRVVRRISDAQWQWLQADLAANRQPVTFVFLHDEIFRGSGARSQYLPEEEAALHDLFLKAGVTVVFQGNENYYDFFKQDGLAYVITGGAGSPLFKQPYDPYWSQHHAMLVEVTPERVTLEALLPNGLLLDRQTIPVAP